MTQEKKPLDNYSAMNNKAASVKKNDLIIIKNHPEREGQMYCVAEVKRDGSVRTTENQIFYPEFFDKISNWEQYNGGFAKFNQATGELVKETDLKKYLEDRWQLNDGREGWVNFIVLQVETDLNPNQLRAWLEANEGKLVERNPDPKDKTDEEWRLIRDDCTICTVGMDDELKQHEQAIFKAWQAIVKGFYTIGSHLKQINDKQLYKLKNCSTFKEYVARFSPFSYNYAFKQIAATEVFDEIRPSLRLNYTNCIAAPDCTNCTVDLKESHLRPLTDKSLTTELRQKIWENVELEIEESLLDGKKPKLTSQLVEKTVWEFTQDKNSPQPQPLESGQICKVELKSNIDSGLKQHNKKLIRVVEQNNRGVKCTTLWGEPIEDCFFREELQDLKDEEFYSSSINLPVEFWKKLSKKGRSLNEAISHLLEEK